MNESLRKVPQHVCVKNDISRCALALACLVCVPTMSVLQAAVGLGHADFYPSDERPVGHRGDGNGVYPEATPVTFWTEGSPVEKNIKRNGKKHTRWALADDKAVNICWRRQLPGFANSHPIIVGDRVFTTSDPHWLICLDIQSGKELWRRMSSPFAAQGLSQAEVDQLDVFVDMLYAARAPIPTMVGNYTNLPIFQEHLRPHWMQVFSMVLPTLQKLVDDNVYGFRAEPVLRQVEKALLDLDALRHGQEGKPVAEQFGKFFWQGRMAGVGADWIRTTYKLFAYVHWDGWTGFTFASPCSDGRHVYQWIGQGQVVCYDLLGNLVWQRHLGYEPEGKAERGAGITHLPSPVLVGDVFCVQSQEYLVGLNKKTGEELWRVKNSTHHFSVGTAKHLVLPNGTDVIVPTSGKVIRVRDGVELASLGVHHSTGPVSGGESMVGVGNRVFLPAHRTNEVMAFDLGPDEGATCTVTKVWSLPGSSVNTSPIIIGNRYYRFGKKGEVIDWQTGKILPPTVNFTIKSGGVGPILAGQQIVWFESGPTGAYRGPRLLASQCQVLTLQEDGSAKMSKKVMLLDGRPRAAMPRFQRYNPTFWQAERYSPEGGVPHHFAHGGFAAQGNRLLLRSCDALICIGDPAVPYDWNAQSRPADLQAHLQALESVTLDAPALVKKLQSPYRSEQERALTQLQQVKAGERAALVSAVAALVNSDHWFTRSSAATLLTSFGTEAAAAAPALLNATTAALQQGKGQQAQVFVKALRHIAPQDTASLLNLLKEQVHGSAMARQQAACRAIRELGPAAHPMLPDLTAVLQTKDAALLCQAALAVAAIGPKATDALPALLGLLTHKDLVVHEAALRAISAIGIPSAGFCKQLAKHCSHPHAYRALQVITLVQASTHNTASLPALHQALSHKAGLVVVAAARAILTIDPSQYEKLGELLAEQLEDGSDAAAYNAARALQACAETLCKHGGHGLAIEGLRAVINKRKKDVQAMAAIALRAYGGNAKSAIRALHEAALGPDIPALAKQAMKAIDPSINVEKLKPIISDDDDDDDDLDLELD